MRQLELSGLGATVSDLIPDGVGEGHGRIATANGVAFDGKDKHHKNNEGRKPEAVHPGLTAVGGVCFHGSDYTAQD